MATRKVKRYAEGDYIEDDAVPTAEQNAKNTEDAGQVELERIRDKAAAEPTSFKAAFAAARSAGDKTFEFGGKKYTTELAGAKSASKPSASSSANSRIPVPEPVKTKPASAEPSKPKYQSLADRAASYAEERAKSGTGMYGTKTNAAKKADAEAAEETRRLRNRVPPSGRGVINTRDIDSDTLLPKKGMKKGGDVKGWGIARGARKAKMY